MAERYQMKTHKRWEGVESNPEHRQEILDETTRDPKRLADLDKIAKAIDSAAESHTDYVENNTDFADAYSHLPGEMGYSDAEVPAEIHEVLAMYDLSFDDVAEELFNQSKAEYFSGYGKLADEYLTFAYFNINEEELQIGDEEIKLSGGKVALGTALKSTTREEFEYIQKALREAYLPDRMWDNLQRPSRFNPSFEVYIEFQGYVTFYMDGQDAVNHIVDKYGEPKYKATLTIEMESEGRDSAYTGAPALPGLEPDVAPADYIKDLNKTAAAQLKKGGLVNNERDNRIKQLDALTFEIDLLITIPSKMAKKQPYGTADIDQIIDGVADFIADQHRAIADASILYSPTR